MEGANSGEGVTITSGGGGGKLGDRVVGPDDGRRKRPKNLLKLGSCCFLTLDDSASDGSDDSVVLGVFCGSLGSSTGGVSRTVGVGVGLYDGRPVLGDGDTKGVGSGLGLRVGDGDSKGVGAKVSLV